MTVVTPTLSLTLYDSSGDQAVTFATFRAVWGGTATTSNFYRIDTWAGTVNSSISTLQNQRGAIPVSATYVSANYYEATVASISSYVTNMTVLIVLDTDSNGTVTLNINALGTKSLMKVDSTGAFVNISGAELQSGRYYLFIYDGTRFVWANATSADQIYHGGTSGNVVTVASNGSISDSTAPSTLLSGTIHAATAKTTLADADEFGIIDSAASNVLKRIVWSDVVTAIGAKLGSIISGLSSKTAPIGADSLVISDSENSNSSKEVLLSDMWKAIGTGTPTSSVYLNGTGAWSRPTGLIQGQGATLTISGGSITPTHTFHRIDTESGAATDDLDTIVTTNMLSGDILVLVTASNARDVTYKDSTGNMALAGDYAVTNPQDTIMLIFNNTTSLMLELGRSDNL